MLGGLGPSAETRSLIKNTYLPNPERRNTQCNYVIKAKFYNQCSNIK